MALDNKVLENAKRLGLNEKVAATVKEEANDSPHFEERNEGSELKEEEKEDLNEKKVKDEDSEEEVHEKGDKNVEKRIGRLIGKNKELQEKYDELFRRVNEAVGPINDSQEPKVDDYATIDEFAKATREYHNSRAAAAAQQLAYRNEQQGKLEGMLKRGKEASGDLGITPEEYHDRVMDSSIKWYPAAKEELFDCEHGHLIAHDIAEHRDEFNALAEKDRTRTGAKQVAWIAKREAHYANLDKMQEEGGVNTKPRKTTKAAAPDDELSRGLGTPDTESLTHKDGSANMKAARKIIKGRSKGFGY